MNAGSCRRALLLAGLLASASGPVLADFADQYRAAVAAYRSGDAAGFLEAARGVRESRPDSPQAAYLLAAAEAMSGQSDTALGLLQGLADQELYFAPQEEPAFATLNLVERAPELLASFEANRAPRGDARVVFRLNEGPFVPEGIAWDEKARRYLLGSIHQRRIMAIDDDGKVSEWIASGEGGLLSVFGMRVDPADRGLWVATAGLRESGGIEAAQIGRSGILEFDLDTGELRRTFWLPDDGAQHVLGDLLLLDGQVITTDSLGGSVLRLDPGLGTFERIVPEGRLVSPQGLAPAAASGAVFVADYRGGIFRLDLTSGTLQKVREAGTTHHGIDGLYRHGDWLIAIQNGVRPHRVVALRPDPSGSAVQEYRVLAAALPEFDEPTLGVIVDGRLSFVANSHWPRFDPEGGLPDGLSGPVVLSVALP